MVHCLYGVAFAGMVQCLQDFQWLVCVHMVCCLKSVGWLGASIPAPLKALCVVVLDCTAHKWEWLLLCSKY